MSRAQRYQGMIVPALSNIGDFSMINVNSGTDGKSAGTYMQSIDAGFASIVDISSTCFTSTYIDQVQNLSSVLVSASTVHTDTLTSSSRVTSTNMNCTSMSTHDINASTIFVLSASTGALSSNSAQSTTATFRSCNACILNAVVSNTSQQNCSLVNSCLTVFAVCNALNANASNLSVDNATVTILNSGTNNVQLCRSNVLSSLQVNASLGSIDMLQANVQFSSPVINTTTATITNGNVISCSINNASINTLSVSSVTSSLVSTAGVSALAASLQYLNVSSADIYAANIYRLTYITQSNATQEVSNASISNCCIQNASIVACLLANCSIVTASIRNSNVSNLKSVISNLSLINTSLINACTINTAIQNACTVIGTTGIIDTCTVTTLSVPLVLNSSLINCSSVLNVSYVSCSSACFINASVSFLLNCANINVSKLSCSLGIYVCCSTSSFIGNETSTASFTASVTNVSLAYGRNCSFNNTNTSLLTCNTVSSSTVNVSYISASTMNCKIHTCSSIVCSSFINTSILNCSTINSCTINTSICNSQISNISNINACTISCSLLNGINTSYILLLSSVRGNIQTQIDTLSSNSSILASASIGNVSMYNASIKYVSASIISCSSILASQINISTVSCSLLSVSIVSSSSVSTTSACCTSFFGSSISCTNASTQALTVFNNASMKNLYAWLLNANSVYTPNSCFLNMSSTSACITSALVNNASITRLNVSTLSASSITVSFLNGLSASILNYLSNVNNDVQGTMDALLNLLYMMNQNANDLNATTATIESVACTNLDVTSNASFAIINAGILNNDTGNISDLFCTGTARFTNNIITGYSDDRLKKRTSELKECVPIVSSWTAFTYIPCDNNAFHLQQKEDIGLSAQEVQVSFPQLVDISPVNDAYLTLRYERIVPILVQCIRELNEKVRRLELQNNY